LPFKNETLVTLDLLELLSSVVIRALLAGDGTSNGLRDFLGNFSMDCFFF